MKRIFFCVFLLGVFWCVGASAVFAATVNGCWDGDPNYPWYGKCTGSHFVSYADLSSAYQERNKVFVNIIVIAGKGEHSGEVRDVRLLEMTIESRHRVRSYGNTIFDPDSDFNEKDPMHYDRNLFRQIDEKIGIQR